MQAHIPLDLGNFSLKSLTCPHDFIINFTSFCYFFFFIISSFNIITFKLQSSIFNKSRWNLSSIDNSPHDDAQHVYTRIIFEVLSLSHKSILTREICVIVSNSPLKNYRNYFAVISMINRFLAAYGTRKRRRDEEKIELNYTFLHIIWFFHLEMFEWSVWM